MRRALRNREAADCFYRHHFGAFAYLAFEALHHTPLVPNWHIDAICHRAEEMMMGKSRRRLVLNAPPRSLKSFLISVALPTWILGRDPSAKLVCASYSEDLAFKFSRDCRALIETRFYKRVFPRTRLNPKKTSESEFETTQRGCRFATSVHATLTGRGGNFLIIDDPIKADDAYSQAALRGANDWLRNTARSRLDDERTSLIIIAMQRLHVEDLSGMVLEWGWPALIIPARAVAAADYPVGPNEVYHRPVGELLQPDRDSPEVLADLELELGSHVFAAQYQQTPTPPDGNMIKAASLRRYHGKLDPANRADRAECRHIVLSCDPAGKPGMDNDYTAICMLAVINEAVLVLDVSRGRWTVMQMRDAILAYAAYFKPDRSEERRVGRDCGSR